MTLFWLSASGACSKVCGPAGACGVGAGGAVMWSSASLLASEASPLPIAATSFGQASTDVSSWRALAAMSPAKAVKSGSVAAAVRNSESERSAITVADFAAATSSSVGVLPSLKRPDKIPKAFDTSVRSASNAA